MVTKSQRVRLLQDGHTDSRANIGPVHKNLDIGQAHTQGKAKDDSAPGATQSLL